MTDMSEAQHVVSCSCCLLFFVSLWDHYSIWIEEWKLCLRPFTTVTSPRRINVVIGNNCHTNKTASLVLFLDADIVLYPWQAVYHCWPCFLTEQQVFILWLFVFQLYLIPLRPRVFEVGPIFRSEKSFTHRLGQRRWVVLNGVLWKHAKGARPCQTQVMSFDKSNHNLTGYALLLLRGVILNICSKCGWFSSVSPEEGQVSCLASTVKLPDIWQNSPALTWRWPSRITTMRPVETSHHATGSINYPLNVRMISSPQSNDIWIYLDDFWCSIFMTHQFIIDAFAILDDLGWSWMILGCFVLTTWKAKWSSCSTQVLAVLDGLFNHIFKGHSFC